MFQLFLIVFYHWTRICDILFIYLLCLTPLMKSDVIVIQDSSSSPDYLSSCREFFLCRTPVDNYSFFSVIGKSNFPFKWFGDETFQKKQNCRWQTICKGDAQTRLNECASFSFAETYWNNLFKLYDWWSGTAVFN